MKRFRTEREIKEFHKKHNIKVNLFSTLSEDKVKLLKDFFEFKIN